MHQQGYERLLQNNQLPTLWEIPDPLWERIETALPAEKRPGTPGRPVVPFRKVMNGILYVLRTGCHWKAVPATGADPQKLH